VILYINRITIDCGIEWCKQEQHMMKYKEVMAIFRKQCKFINNFLKFIANFCALDKSIVLTLSTDLLFGTSAAI